jgi:hypothetical protein
MKKHYAAELGSGEEVYLASEVDAKLEAAEKENAELALENVGLAATLKLKYESELEAARGMAVLLRKIEYVPNGFGYDICPACTMSGISGHEDNCGLRKALTAWREASGSGEEGEK